MLQGQIISGDADDKMVWLNSECGTFSVKSLCSSFFNGRTGICSSYLVWNPWIPLKVVFFFAWQAAWGRNLTLDQLKRRGWGMLNRCYLCKGEEETVDHIFHCGSKAVIFCRKNRNPSNIKWKSRTRRGLMTWSSTKWMNAI